MKKYIFNIFFVILIFSLFLCFSSTIFAADPKIVTTINSSLNKIKDWIVKISTPAAAVAVGTGLLMKKFSFGDEERILIGKKLIKNSLFSYAFILCIDLVLKAISSLVGA